MATRENDYDGNYEELIRHELNNLQELEKRVPQCYWRDIHSAVISLEGILCAIKRNREFEDWNN